MRLTERPITAREREAAAVYNEAVRAGVGPGALAQLFHRAFLVAVEAGDEPVFERFDVGEAGV